MLSETYRLTAMHHSLDKSIRTEMSRRAPNTMRLLRLKKLRLSVKDRLASLMRTGR